MQTNRSVDDSVRSDLGVQLTISLWVLCLIILLIFGGFRCTASQLAALENAGYSFADCSLNAALSCSAQAAAGCGLRSAVEDWSEYAGCLSSRAEGCVGSSLARCSLASVVKISGAIAGGSSGCDPDQVRTAVAGCIDAREPATESEAVQVVADCYLEACGVSR